MHIPDGYLGPQTYLPAYGIMAPIWAVALRKVKQTVRTRQVPLLALGAAFSFLIMMFNVPIPGGTTGHAVGSVLVAILLGPWAAVVAVSLALTVQAFLFGDGGITALGANCLTMALLMPFAGWWTYRFLSGRSRPEAGRRVWAAAIAGYVGLNAGALLAGILFGLQPHIARDAAGHALYCPYGLSIAIPAMMSEHLLLFGLIEAAATGLVVAYVRRSEPALLEASAPMSPIARRLAWGIALLVLLCPLGLWLPEKLGAGDAWGEWSVEDVAAKVGFTPARMSHLASLWHAPMPDYALPGQEDAPLSHLSATYILSAFVGVAILALITWAGRGWLLRRDASEADS